MKNYIIIPKKEFYSEIKGKNKEDAMAAFAAMMNTDMNLYFKAVTPEEYKVIKEQESDAAAHARFVTAFMKNTLMEDFDVPEEDAQDVAENAYDIYCDGNGQTEYECIEEAFDEYQKIQEAT